MPSGAIQSATALLERGALPRYRDAYDRRYRAVSEKLAKIMELGIPSDKAIEILPYMLAMPHAKAWRDGESIPEGAALSRSFTIVNRPWGIRLPVREADVTFDQVDYLLQSVSQAGESVGWIPERVLFQILLGSVDLDLLPAVPNAADGAALYSQTDGSGANRFGVANGNLYGGGTTASVAAVIADLYGAIGRGKRFQDGQGQPLHPQDVFDAPIVVIAGAHNELVFQQAMAQKFVFQDAGGNRAAAPTNLILDAGLKVELWLTQRVPTGNDDWFLFFTGVQHKAIANTVATPVRQIFKTPENSDWCSTYRCVLMQWDMLQGFGIGEAFGTIKIDN